MKKSNMTNIVFTAPAGKVAEGLMGVDDDGRLKVARI